MEQWGTWGDVDIKKVGETIKLQTPINIGSGYFVGDLYLALVTKKALEELTQVDLKAVKCKVQVNGRDMGFLRPNIITKDFNPDKQTSYRMEFEYDNKISVEIDTQAPDELKDGIVYAFIRGKMQGAV